MVRRQSLLNMTNLLIVLLLISTSEACSNGGTALQNFLRNMLHSPSERLVQLITENEESMKRPIISSSEGIYFSIRSTVKYHSTRLPSIILTWLQNIHPSQVKI